MPRRRPPGRRVPPVPTGPVQVPWSLRERRSALVSDRDLDPGEVPGRAAAEADTWLRELFVRAIGDGEGVALLAVGGLGRRELLPGSDLDLLLVHDRHGDVAAAAERLWYPIWDDAQNLDHSVRTLAELQKAADADLRVALGLLDARGIAGDPDLADQALRRVDRLWQARLRRWLAELVELAGERQASGEEVAFLLEPDLKADVGGVRDATVLRAVAGVTPVLRPAADDPALADATAELRRILVALARSTPGRRRAGTRLLLQDQDAVAAALDLADADELMGRVAAAGRTVAAASEDGWRRAASWLRGPLGRAGSADRPVGPGLVRRDGEIALDTGADPAGDPSLALRAAVAAVEQGTVIARPALDRLAATPPARSSNEPWPASSREAFVRLLGLGHQAVSAFETLDRRGLLAGPLPEWEAVRNRPQRNAYHRFTVDRHLLETAAQAADLVRLVSRPDLLLVTALLHDIGKGGSGDHSDTGARRAGAIATRMGFDAGDVAVIERLVRHHLLLADTATRRDLSDPATVQVVAAAVQDRNTLELLAALTEADGLATGATAWSPWKAGLVAALVQGVERRLAGEPPAAPGTSELDPATEALVSDGNLAVLGVGDRVTVVAPDRPGLFSAVTGVLAARGVDVRAAQSATVEATAVIHFDVAPAYRELPAWGDIQTDIAAALEGRLRLAERLADQDRARRRHLRPRQAGAPEVSVSFDDAASQRATVIDVRAPDALGVLSRIAGALTACGLVIDAARVVSLGAEVLDTFYVRDGQGRPIIDPDERRQVTDAVRGVIEHSP